MFAPGRLGAAAAYNYGVTQAVGDYVARQDFDDRSYPDRLKRQVALKMMGVKSAEELARVFVAVGLAQNFAAVLALATEGLRGHMKLHAQNIALMAGAKGDEIDAVAKRLVELGKVRADLAETELAALRAKR